MLARQSQTGERPVARAARTRHITHQGLTWIDIIHPGNDEIAFLRDHYPFHPLNLEDCLSRIQRPKIDIYPEEQHLFLVLHFPIFDRDRRVATAGEVDLFIGRNYIITLHDGRLKPLSRLFNVLSVDEALREQRMSRGAGFLLYRMLDELVRYCFPMVDQVYQNLERIEDQMFGRNVRATVEEISFVRRDIIALRRIVRPNINVMRSLETRDFDFLNFDEAAYFGDVTDGLSKIADLLDEQNEIITSFNATVDSLTSHKINEIMKILTAISVVLLPMTLLASLYGMNVPLPFEGQPWAFGIIVLLMISGAIGMLLYFRRNDWI